MKPLFFTLASLSLFASQGIDEMIKETFLAIVEVAPSSEYDKLFAKIDEWETDDETALPLTTYLKDRLYLIRSSGKSCDFAKMTLRDELSAEKSLFMRFPGVTEKQCHAFSELIGFEFATAPSAIDHIHANLWEQLHTASDTDQVFLREMITTVKQVGSLGTLHDLREHFAAHYPSEFKDLYYLFPEASQATIAHVYAQLSEEKAPKITHNDEVLRQLVVWQKESSLGSDDHKLASWLIEQMDTIGSFGDFEAFVRYGKMVHSRQFAMVPKLSEERIREFNAILGHNAKVEQAVADAKRWFESLDPEKDGASYRLAKVTLSDLESLKEDPEAYAKAKMMIAHAFPPHRDIYMQFPGVSRDDVARRLSFVDIFEVPAPTAIDRVFAKLYDYQGNHNPHTAEYHLAQMTLNQLEEIGSYGTLLELHAWAETTFKDHDLFLRYPNLSEESIALYADHIAYSPLKVPTTLDLKYREVVHHLQKMAPESALADLTNQFLAAIRSFGSHGDFHLAQEWAQRTLFENERDSELSLHEKQLFRRIAGLNYDVKKFYIYALSLVDESALTEGALITHFVGDLKQLRASKISQREFNQYLSELQSKEYDLYMKFPTATKPEVQSLYDLLYLGQAPDPTPMDLFYQDLNAWHRAGLTENEVPFYDQIDKKVRAMGSLGDVADLSEWFNTEFIGAHCDLYLQFPGLEMARVAFLFDHLPKVETVRPTIIDIKAGQVMAWKETLSPRSFEFFLAESMLEKMKELGSQGDYETLQLWAKSFIEGRKGDLEKDPAESAHEAPVQSVFDQSDELGEPSLTSM